MCQNVELVLALIPTTVVAVLIPLLDLRHVKVANSKLWRRLIGLKVAQQFLPQCQSCSQAQV